jgi:hypothetical protein
MAVAMFSSVNSQSIAFSIVTRDDDDKAGEILHTLKSGKHLDMIVKKIRDAPRIAQAGECLESMDCRFAGADCSNGTVRMVSAPMPETRAGFPSGQPVCLITARNRPCPRHGDVSLP